MANMTLLDSKPPKPPSRFRKLIIITVVWVVVLGGLLGYRFWNYGEERAVARFLTALEQGDYKGAYALWQPAPSYRYHDFLRDWGEQGDYGKIRSFEILFSKSKGRRTVLVTVSINKVQPPLVLAVDRNTKGLAYSIF